MVKHQEDHPGLDVPGCFACRISSVQLAPSATPSRGRGAHAVHHNRLESQWHKDMDAYKRLRYQGLQPPTIDGSAHRETTATTREQIER